MTINESIEKNQIRAFFNERRIKCLNISAICREAGIPERTLDHFLKRRRELNEGHLKALIPVLNDLGYKSL